ncbi:NUDIX domain-containing protein [Methylomonas sp. SURF-2]|uniref:NUDIX domain-containing protein n=1 Tax=Methylomonas subterranea TaxID=2952225 RepID=A0ABT1THT2_9GAMM|nr:NUDIX domain-containing protein [Methylomonas sp. SURF-2]MCQ8104329.1 NUDIX domain-containing protein [Methylomonas sp. SURF-2]
MPTAELIQSLLPHLPRFAEEEGDFYSVPRVALIEALCQSQTLERAIAENTVALLETLLDTLAVLDTAALQNGEWRFVSFPAQLLATSVLTAMSDHDSRLFAAHFWNTQGIDNARKDQQRDVLRAIELARVEHHSDSDAQPIRYCYVSWSIIKLDGKILFYQREDTHKRFDKAAGDYGLLGGRCNQTDVTGITDKAVLLQALQSANSQLVKGALPQTLRRELREEAGLLFEEHYHFNLWRDLKPYRQVQGAAPNHALTEYYLAIFQIELTLEGFLFLQQRVAKDERLAWLTLADIERGESSDGKIPYIKALYDDFAGDRTALVAALSELPESFAPVYLSDKDKFGISLPIDPGKPVFAGVLGKEKALDLSLNARQLTLILGLAAHLRGFAFESVPENIVMHPHGWVEVGDLSPLRQELTELLNLLAGSELVMESRRDRLFRLSIRPDTVFFADELFAFSVKLADLQGVQNKIPATITRRAFDTGFGVVLDKTEVFKLTLDFAHKLKSLSEYLFSADNDDGKKIEDTYKKGLHKESRFKALGLRNLIREEGATIRFVLPYVCQ